jgi:hypothetical protein
MPNMDVWSWVLGSIGAFVAVTALVRLMRRRRDEVLAELTAVADRMLPFMDTVWALLRRRRRAGARILFEGVDPHEALRTLMARPPRTEEEAG